MGNPKAFLNIKRKDGGYRPVYDRMNDYAEVEQTLNIEDRKQQASRCMECGVPFCHKACPLGNIQPEWQDLLYKGNFKGAYELLSSTNDFPEFTGRICPALCEKSCVLALVDDAVTIRENEAALAENAFAYGYVVPRVVSKRSGKSVAVVGSGPAGLVAASRLNQMGHSVTVYEKDEYVGGLLRLGIPDFKLNKAVVERRVDILQKEGIRFVCSTQVGRDISYEQLKSDFDAIVLTVGCSVPRNLDVQGRQLDGVHLALDMLKMQNRIVSGADIQSVINAKGKKVVVIGGGDTGSDCVGTSIRQKAVSVMQIEIMPKPPEVENPQTPWPAYPQILRTSSSHLEGCEREWSLSTRRFVGTGDKLCGVEVERVEWVKDQTGRMSAQPTGEIRVLEADLVLLAMGFVAVESEGIIAQSGVELTPQGNIMVDDRGQTSVEGLFAAGDSAMGASLVVRAMASARDMAIAVDEYLTK